MAEGGYHSLGAGPGLQNADYDSRGCASSKKKSSKTYTSGDEAPFIDEETWDKDAKKVPDIETAWETLDFKVSIKNSVSVYDATKEVDICKLQFVLKSDLAKKDFLLRQKEKMEFQILAPGVVHIKGIVVADGTIDAFWRKLIHSINFALDSKYANSIRLSNESELRNALQKLDDDTTILIVNGIVGLFVSFENNACTAKIIGAQPDMDKILNSLKSVVESGRQKRTEARAETVHHGSYRKSVTVEEYREEIKLTVDEDFYFHVINITDNLKKKFPGVRVTREGNDKRTFKFVSTDLNELKEATSWFYSCSHEMRRKELKLSKGEFKFITESENVQIYLRKELLKVPAELRVSSNKIYILCHQSHLESSERIIYDNIKSVEVEGKWFCHEADKIRKESREKIQYVEGYGTDRNYVIYTGDVTASAIEFVKMLRNYKYTQERLYSQHRLDMMKVLGVLEDIQYKFKDILIKEYGAVVILRGLEENYLAACLEELDTKAQNLEAVQLNNFPTLVQKLLGNGKVQLYVKENIKEKIVFQKGKGCTCLIFIKENEKSKATICRDIRACFMEMKIDTQWLQNKSGKTFLRNNSEKVVQEDHETYVTLCFTADLSEEVKTFVGSYSKDCAYTIKDYLQRYGDECISEIGKKHIATIELENNKICAKGPYNRGKKAIAEIESHVNTTVLHFEESECQPKALSEKDNSNIDTIAKSCRCCWNAVVYPFQPPRTEDKGIAYLCTWMLPTGNEEISVAKIDYNNAKFDVLIIPVNECFFAEDIENNEFFDRANTSKKKAIGSWESVKPIGKYASIKTIALVTSESCIVENKQSRKVIDTNHLQRSCSDIMESLFSKKGQFEIGFAVPGNDKTFVGQLEAVISGFQETTQLNDTMKGSKLLLIVKTEAERCIQEVDNILKYSTHPRRHISATYCGLLNRPTTSVKLTDKSIIDTGANCIVVAISRDLDLSMGYISKLVSKACGEQLQQYLCSKNLKILKPWEIIMCPSFDLSKKGIQKIIFGSIPHWLECQKIEELEKFIESCLYLADRRGCTKVAFPALGTGKIVYPPRDVSVALFNGVDKYVTGGTIGKISLVYFSVPNQDDYMQEILVEEQKRRKLPDSSTRGEHPEDDLEYLVAENDNVNYYIVSESVCEKMPSGKFVNVRFKPDYTAKEIVPMLPWNFVVRCRQTKESLKEGVIDVLLEIDRQRITSVNIFCINSFKKISMEEQTHIICESVVEAAKHFDRKGTPMFKYLENVRIVVSDAAYSLLRDLKLNEENPSTDTTYKQVKHLAKSLYNKGFGFSENTTPLLKWYIDHYLEPVTRTCLNVILTGCKHSDIERAKEEITEYITTKDDDVSVDEDDDNVTAEINPGIVKYLASLATDEFKKWRREFRSAFKVHIKTDRNITKMEISGTFNRILQTEEYFENNFPEPPKNGQVGLEFSDQHYKSDIQNEKDDPVGTKDNQVTSQQKSKEFIVRTMTQPRGNQNTMNVTVQELSYKFTNVNLTVKCCDITDLSVDGIVSPVNEFFNTKFGVASAIASKAGKAYFEECKAILDKGQHLGLAKCKVTGSGNLSKCKHVMHVHSPVKVRQMNYTNEELSQLKKSIENCLTEANEQGWKSIAIPFLCTGVAGFTVSLCAQEYFRAIVQFKEHKCLEKVFFVDIDKKKVSDVCCTISSCCNDKFIGSARAELSLSSSNLQSVKCYVTGHDIFSISADAVAMRVDERFNGYKNELSDLLSCSDASFKARFEERRREVHDPTSVTHIPSSGTYKHVLFAVAPKWTSNTDECERNVRITMTHVLEKAESLKSSSLACPVLCLDDNPVATTTSCHAMVESILQFFSYKQRSVRTIQLSANGKQIIDYVNAFVDQQMQDEKETMV